jgi:tetratricopeptide (TPR) repeat protein
MRGWALGQSCVKRLFLMPRGGNAARLLLMGMIAPLVIVGIWMGMAWAVEREPQDVRAPFAAAEGLGGYLQGAVADLQGDLRIAVPGYVAALADDPDNVTLRRRTLEVALLDGDIPLALRLAKSLPAVDQSTLSRLLLATAAAQQGNLEEARTKMAAAAKAAPDLLQFRLLQAYVDFAMGKPANQVIATLEKSVVAPSLRGRLQYHVARLWLKDGKIEPALNALRAARTAEPAGVQATLLLGETLARQGKVEEAMAEYDRFRLMNSNLTQLVPAGKTMLQSQPLPFASSLSDDMAATLTDFALVVWAQGGLVPARQLFQLTLFLQPQDYVSRYYLGMLLEMGGDLELAQAQYMVLTAEMMPPVPPGLRLAAGIRQAEMMAQTGDADGAWRELRALQRTSEDSLQLRQSLAQVAVEREDYRAAAKEYAAVQALLPVNTAANVRASVLFARGAALERQGNKTAAAELLQEALALDPENASIMNYLGYMWVEQNKNLVEAYALLQKAHALAPDDGAITDSLGWAYYQKGAYSTALTYLQQALDLEPSSPEIWDHTGDALAKLGKQAEAVRHWQRALDLAEQGMTVPSKDFAAKVRRKLR